jgi:hypothetical protein
MSADKFVTPYRQAVVEHHITIFDETTPKRVVTMSSKKVQTKSRRKSNEPSYQSTPFTVRRFSEQKQFAADRTNLPQPVDPPTFVLKDVEPCVLETLNQMNQGTVFYKRCLKTIRKTFDPLLGDSCTPDQCGYSIRMLQLDCANARVVIK